MKCRSLLSLPAHLSVPSANQFPPHCTLFIPSLIPGTSSGELGRWQVTRFPSNGDVGSEC